MQVESNCINKKMIKSFIPKTFKFQLAENTHIFELSPEDWKLIFRHSGWNILKERVYLQYPKRHFWFITKALWKKFDFEGFWGAILEKDTTFSDYYQDWEE